MRKRTRKVLSIVLSAAMVLSLNVPAMAAEETAEVNEVTYADDGDAIIKNATDPLSWNSAENGKAAMSAVLYGGIDDHLVNKEKKTVSFDSVVGVSFNILPLSTEGYYLIFGYNDVDVEGEGCVADAGTYDGRKKVFAKKGKDTSSKEESLYGALGLVKYNSSEKTVTEYGGVTISDFKLKNNVNATISANKTWKGTKEDPYDRFTYDKIGDLGTFTVTAKVKFSKEDKSAVDKSVKKDIAKVLKDATYKFAIRQKAIKFAASSVLDDDVVSSNKVGYGNYASANIHAKKISTKGPKATLTFNVWTGTDDNGKYVARTINAKDYTLSTAEVGGETVVVLDSFSTTNYEYKPYENKYKLCFRQKDKKTITYGIYASETDAYVDSVE